MSGIPSWARPGVKVVCVRPPFGTGYDWESHPEISGIYTIREVVVVGDRTGLRLVEIVNMEAAYRESFTEVVFLVHRFRPLTEVSESDTTEATLFRKQRAMAPSDVEIVGS